MAEASVSFGPALIGSLLFTSSSPGSAPPGPLRHRPDRALWGWDKLYRVAFIPRGHVRRSTRPGRRGPAGGHGQLRLAARKA
jgi:hypothetical protein